MATALQFDRTTKGAPGGTLSFERHYSPAEIGKMWNLSADCIRKIFGKEPGVLVIGSTIPRRAKRSYTTLRIPQTVLDKVHRRMARV